MTRLLFAACAREDFGEAERWRKEFIPLEDLRDRWGPAKVLHAAIESAGIARTGAVPPYLSLLSPEQLEVVSPVARNLFDLNKMSDNLR
jgi:dihydrodipicolinate synthase/N-acetylneuraminate lyase